jgi:hypothetical protein
MNLPNCEHEAAVLQAVETNEWPEGLRTHANACEVCSEVMLVAHYLQADAQETLAESPLPDAGLIWWKAQRQARQAAVERATLPIAILEKVSWGFGGLSVAGLLTWFWPQIEAVLGMFRLAWAQTSSLGISLQPGSYLLVGGSLLLFLLTFVLYAVWAEE